MKLLEILSKYTSDVKTYVGDEISTNDSGVVHNTGNETIDGVKTFSKQIVGTIDKSEKDKDGSVISTTYLKRSGGTMTGDIVPDTTSTRSVGSSTLKFKEVWADEVHISQNTLYIGDTPVLSTDSDTINIKADKDQSVLLKTTGEGLSQISSETGVTVATNGLNSSISLSAKGTNAGINIAADKAISIVGETVSIDGTTTIKNLNVIGTTTSVNSEDLKVKDNVIELNSGETGTGVSKGTAGIKVNRGDALHYLIEFDETDDLFKVGEQGDLEIIASRPYVDDSVSTLDGKVVHNTGAETIAGVKTFSAGIVSAVTGNVTGNASSATKLQTARTINGTSFNGTANITTANWGTARNISITDGTNTSTAVSVNGSKAYSLNLPSTIKATFVGNITGNVTGNCSGSSGSCTGNSTTATNATNNASGNELTDSIIKGLSVSGKVITYTKLDGTTGTITTQDTNTTYSNMSASEATTGTATNARSISAKVLNDKIDEKIAALISSVPASAVFAITADDISSIVV